MKHRNIVFALCIAHFCFGVQASDFYAGVSAGAAVYDDVAEAGPAQDGLSLDGLNFDSTESAFGVHVGWQARAWLAIEVGYSDLGNSGVGSQAGLAAFGTPVLMPPTQLVPPNIDTSVINVLLTNPLLFPGNAFVGRSALTAPARPAAIGASQWHVEAEFRVPLRERLYAHWTVGLARTSFDAEGAINVFTLNAVPPLSATAMRLPNAAPGDETGIGWGFGFDFELNERFDLGADWRRRDTGVLDIDTFLSVDL